MHLAFLILTGFSAVSFFCYGASCLMSNHMRQEFTRFRLEAFRVPTGVLQLLGAAGQVLGLWLLPVGMAGSLGLSLLMLLGVGVRVRIRDTLVQSLPAAFYFVLNAGLFLLTLKLWLMQ